VAGSEWPIAAHFGKAACGEDGLQHELGGGLHYSIPFNYEIELPHDQCTLHHARSVRGLSSAWSVVAFVATAKRKTSEEPARPRVQPN
jgi:hypothetical protein